jgi:ubiquitin-protein ligase
MLRSALILRLVPVELLFDLSFRTNYPFNPPQIRIISGAEVFALCSCFCSGVLAASWLRFSLWLSWQHIPAQVQDNGMLVLALADNWTPSNVVKDLLRDMGELIQQAPRQSRQEQSAQAMVYELGNRLPLGAFPGQVFECFADSSWSKTYVLMLVALHGVQEFSSAM